jgi:hypothetical protein
MAALGAARAALYAIAVQDAISIEFRVYGRNYFTIAILEHSLPL